MILCISDIENYRNWLRKDSIKINLGNLLQNEILLYTDENGKTNVNVRFAEEATYKDFLLVQPEGKRQVKRQISQRHRNTK